jgi:hypothetical protein
MTAAVLTEEERRRKARRRRNERVPFDWQIVKVEQTGMCDEGWIAESKIKTCGVFYLFDRNRHVHICSFEPLYECFPICGYAESTIPLGVMTDKESEELGDFELEMLNSEENACAYMGVPETDRMPRQPVHCALKREPEEDCETYYNRAVEEMLEDLRGNPPWF